LLIKTNLKTKKAYTIMPYYNGCGLYTFLYKLQELCVNNDIFSFFFFFLLNKWNLTPLWQHFDQSYRTLRKIWI